MKRVIIFAATAILLFACKKMEFEPIGPTDVRIYNSYDINSGKTFENVIVNTSGGEYNFGTISPKTTTEYHRFEKSYPKIDISLTINGIKYSTKTQDYTYQNYLGQVKCTYRVYILNDLTHTLETEVVYDAPLEGI